MKHCVAESQARFGPEEVESVTVQARYPTSLGSVHVDKDSDALMTPKASDEVFIVRFWNENGSRSTRHWRARVNVLSSGKERHADSVEGVVKIIRAVLTKATRGEN